MASDGGDSAYRLHNQDFLLTPALAIYPEFIRHNIETTLRLLGGHRKRWRPHVKTSKLALVMRMLVEAGMDRLKCATTLELLTACQVGAADVLLAFPATAPLARRASEIAEAYPNVRISVLVDDPLHLASLKGLRLGVFVDINPGMNRTGVPQERLDRIVSLVRSVGDMGLTFRGVHYYDGHLHGPELNDRVQRACEGYAQALRICEALGAEGFAIEEVITGGTPTFPAGLAFDGFAKAGLAHSVSPGTLVYNDATSLKQLPAEYGYKPAAVVVTRVVSHPREDVVTCDAGHKAVSADAGVPTCEVLGWPNLRPLRPSEEHLPLQVEDGSPVPKIGEVLYLLPRHICPSVNTFGHALIVKNGDVTGMERVDSRGREAPLKC
ncbi:MAG: alanine racemase [Candidatus Korobacteraceae bacterium]